MHIFHTPHRGEKEKWGQMLTISEAKGYTGVYYTVLSTFCRHGNFQNNLGKKKL